MGETMRKPRSPRGDGVSAADHGRVMWSQARYVLDDLATSKYSLATVRAANKKAMVRDLKTITAYIEENI